MKRFFISLLLCIAATTAFTQSREYQNVTGYYAVQEYRNGRVEIVYQRVTLRLMIIDTSDSGLLTYGSYLKIYVTAYKFSGQDWNKLYNPIEASQSTNREFSYVVSLSLGVYGVVYFDY